MNFFGHAAVATWRSSAPAFVLGSMLPDFASMVGARQPDSRHPEITAGIAFHHATDDVFHDCPSFRRLLSQALDALGELGVARGSARAVAHVGVEILLDGELSKQGGAAPAYLAALRSFAELSIDWRAPADALAARGLVVALGARGVSPEHSAPDVVALRVARTLARRPRLALSSGEEAKVREWASGARSEVYRTAPALLDELGRGLLNRGALSSIPAAAPSGALR